MSDKRISVARRFPLLARRALTHRALARRALARRALAVVRAPVALVVNALFVSLLLLTALPPAAAHAQTPSSEALIVLDENLLNAVLAGLFRTDGALSYPLGADAGSRECPSAVTLLPEADGTRTGIKLDDPRPVLPLAFRGSYDAGRLGCVRFTGTALAALDLYFDERRQALAARVEVQQLRLSNLPFLAAGGARTLVQETINRRVNPLTLLPLDRLSARLTIKDDAALAVRATGVRTEVKDRALHLRIRYEFAPAK